jgi:CO/xanthine dehydrogenase FAD-binding subunit
VTISADLAMDVFLPSTLDEALHVRGDRRDALVICGGTDVMVGMNFGQLRPPAMMDVSRLPELQRWHREDGSLFLGAGVTYARVMRELPGFTPLVQASRTVGSPQIRNRGTVGGNLGTASPAGDALPVLAAYDAEVVVASAERGERSLPWDRFLVGPKRTALEPDELVLGARWKVTEGPGSFSKIGTRNAMVIAVANLCLVIDEPSRSVRVALGSVGPTIIRAREAESLAAGVIRWDGPEAGIADAAREEFARLVEDAARPIDDVRGTLAYRRHACRIMAHRALGWALEKRRAGSSGGAS